MSNRVDQIRDVMGEEFQHWANKDKVMRIFAGNEQNVAGTALALKRSYGHVSQDLLDSGVISGNDIRATFAVNLREAPSPLAAALARPVDLPDCVRNAQQVLQEAVSVPGHGPDVGSTLSTIRSRMPSTLDDRSAGLLLSRVPRLPQVLEDVAVALDRTSHVGRRDLAMNALVCSVDLTNHQVMVERERSLDRNAPIR